MLAANLTGFARIVRTFIALDTGALATNLTGFARMIEGFGSRMVRLFPRSP